MFGLPSFLLTDREREMMRMREERRRQERLREEHEAFDMDATKWAQRMLFTGESFWGALGPYAPFGAEAVCKSVLYDNEGPRRRSPCGRWGYDHMLLPKGLPLKVWKGRKTGRASFSEDVPIPALWQADDEGGFWTNRMGVKAGGHSPWMSLTVNEALSLRMGERFAKGRCVIGGLGLGFQLQRVARRDKVREIVLVEIDRTLVDWVLPAIEDRLRGKLADVVIGDVYEVLPTLQADSCLLDHYPTYGGNRELFEQTMWVRHGADWKLKLSVGHIWHWGGPWPDEARGGLW